LRAIIGSVYAPHTQYEADCLDWQSIIADGHELLSKADLGQFKALGDNNYFFCRGEYHLYEEWAQVIKAKPRYINIMSGLIIGKNKQAWSDDEDHFDNYSDNGCRQVFFLAHQVLTYHCWLSFCPEEAALFCKFKVSKSVHLFLIMMKISNQ
jgi:hypothetical protein